MFYIIALCLLTVPSFALRDIYISRYIPGVYIYIPIYVPLTPPSNLQKSFNPLRHVYHEKEKQNTSTARVKELACLPPPTWVCWSPAWWWKPSCRGWRFRSSWCTCSFQFESTGTADIYTWSHYLFLYILLCPAINVHKKVQCCGSNIFFFF